MNKKTLSVFIDESGDFGKYNHKSPYYYVSMILHDQSVDISEDIKNLEERVSNYGFPIIQFMLVQSSDVSRFTKMN